MEAPRLSQNGASPDCIIIVVVSDAGINEESMSTASVLNPAMQELDVRVDGARKKPQSTAKYTSQVTWEQTPSDLGTPEPFTTHSCESSRAQKSAGSRDSTRKKRTKSGAICAEKSPPWNHLNLSRDCSEEPPTVTTNSWNPDVAAFRRTSTTAPPNSFLHCLDHHTSRCTKNMKK